MGMQIASGSKNINPIVIQSDHGNPTANPHRGPTLDTAFVRARHAILNAYYFPARDYSQLYPNITPANTFRVILNVLFGAGLAMVEDRNYYSTFDSPWEMREVTEILKAQPPPPAADSALTRLQYYPPGRGWTLRPLRRPFPHRQARHGYRALPS